MSDAERYPRAELMLPGSPCLKGPEHDGRTQKARAAAIRICDRCVQLEFCRSQLQIFEQHAKINKVAVYGGEVITPAPSEAEVAPQLTFSAKGPLPEDEDQIPRYVRMLRSYEGSRPQKPSKIAQIAARYILLLDYPQESFTSPAEPPPAISTIYVEAARLLQMDDSVDVRALRVAAAALANDFKMHISKGLTPEAAFDATMANPGPQKNRAEQQSKPKASPRPKVTKEKPPKPRELPPLPEEPALAIEALRKIPNIFVPGSTTGRTHIAEQLIDMAEIAEDFNNKQSQDLLHRLAVAISRYAGKAQMTESEAALQLQNTWPIAFEEYTKTASLKIGTAFLPLHTLRLGYAECARMQELVSTDPNLTISDLRSALKEPEPYDSLRQFSACVDELAAGNSHRELRDMLTARKAAARTAQPEAEIAAIAKRLELLKSTYGDNKFASASILRYYCILFGKKASNNIEAFLRRCEAMSSEFPALPEHTIASTCRRYSDREQIRKRLNKSLGKYMRSEAATTVQLQQRADTKRQTIEKNGLRIARIAEVLQGVDQEVVSEVLSRFPQHQDTDILAIARLYNKLITFGLPRAGQPHEVQDAAMQARMFNALRELSDHELSALMIVAGSPHLTVKPEYTAVYLRLTFQTPDLTRHIAKTLQEKTHQSPLDQNNKIR